MSRIARFVLLLAAIGTPVPARAQRVQVAAGDPGARSVTIIEFQPCVPAETSACGAWIDRGLGYGADTAGAPIPPALTRVVAFDRDSVWIDDGAVNIRATAARARSAYVVRDKRGRAVALAVSAVPHYVFALLQAPTGTPGAASTIVMIDLDTRSVIDSFSSTARFSGIAMLR